MDPIVLNDLNVDLNKARSPRSQQVVDLLMEYGLIDLVRHFCQHRQFWNLQTWSQVQQGPVLRLRCDYILGTDWRRLEIFGIRYMHNFSSDHFVVRERLLLRPTRCHSCYLRGRRAFLRPPPPTVELIRADTKFQTLKALEMVPPKLKRPPRSVWMSPDSIWLMNKRTALRRNPHHSRNMARGVTRAVCWSLMADSWRLVEEAAREIGACLEPSTGGVDLRGAYAIL